MAQATYSIQRPPHSVLQSDSLRALYFGDTRREMESFLTPGQRKRLSTVFERGTRSHSRERSEPGSKNRGTETPPRPQPWPTLPNPILGLLHFSSSSRQKHHAPVLTRNKKASILCMRRHPILPHSSIFDCRNLSHPTLGGAADP